MFNRTWNYLFGVSEEPVDQYAQEQLLDAARSGDLPGISRYTNLYRNVDIRDENNNTPLILAASHNQVNAVRVLLNHGAVINAADENGYTPLAAAVTKGCLEAADFLISQYANLEARTSIKDPPRLSGLTPLWIAVHHQHEDMVRLLILRGANVHAVDAANNPLLAYAIYCGNTNIVGMLLQAGAERNCRCADGRSAEMIARERQRMDLVALLYADPADIAEMNYLRAEAGSAPQFIEAPDMDFEEDFESETDEPMPPPSASVSEALADLDDDFPNRYLCPISQEVFKDPVTTPFGHTFDRASLREHFRTQERSGQLVNGTVPCPITRQPLPVAVLDFGTNFAIKEEIEEIKKQRAAQAAVPATQLAAPEGELQQKRLKYFERGGLFAVNRPESGLAVQGGASVDRRVLPN